MGNNLRSACDEILQKVVTVKDRVPGVVAMITDRWPTSTKAPPASVSLAPVRQ